MFGWIRRRLSSKKGSYYEGNVSIQSYKDYDLVFVTSREMRRIEEEERLKDFEY